MQRIERNVPLPDEMQGNWVDVEEPDCQLIIQGCEVTCFGERVAYDYKLVDIDDGALTVSLKIDDEAGENAFQRANITELVITPEGEFNAYNLRFASQFQRAEK